MFENSSNRIKARTYYSPIEQLLFKKLSLEKCWPARSKYAVMIQSHLP